MKVAYLPVVFILVFAALTDQTVHAAHAGNETVSSPTGKAYGPEVYSPLISAIEVVFDRAAPSPVHRVSIMKKLLKTVRLEGLLEHIPNLLDDVDVPAFLRRAAVCAADNSYLTSFWTQLFDSSFRPYSDKAAKEQDKVVPHAVLYAVLLDRITMAVRGNNQIYHVIFDTFASATEASPEWKKYVNAFEVAKKYSVDGAVKQYMKAIDSGEALGSFGKNGLPLNIVEAVLEDYRRGVHGNAQAGLAIAFEHPGQSTHDPLTGAGPTTLSGDKKTVWIFPPLPKLWADLYQTWNMNFVSSYENAPMFFAKLANPAVMCYADTPQHYMFHRVVSLYVHVHYEIFTRLDRKGQSAGMEWSDKTLVKLWADHNKLAGEMFQEELNKANPDRATKLSTFKKKMLHKFVQTSGSSVRAIQTFIEWITGRDEYVDEIKREDIVLQSSKFGTFVSKIIKYVMGKNK